MRLLDKTRDYAEVFGSSECQYEQDGLKFNSRGECVSDEPVLTPEPKPKPVSKPRTATLFDGEAPDLSDYAGMRLWLQRKGVSVMGRPSIDKLRELVNQNL
jgi:hypothetical protein